MEDIICDRMADVMFEFCMPEAAGSPLKKRRRAAAGMWLGAFIEVSGFVATSGSGWLFSWPDADGFEVIVVFLFPRDSAKGSFLVVMYSTRLVEGTTVD